MKTGYIRLNESTQGSLRIDPSFFLSEGVLVRSELQRSPYGLVTVGDCASRVFYGNIFSRIWVKNSIHGVPYLAASDTTLSDLDTGCFLAKRQAEQLSYLRLKKDWILVTCSGTIGNVVYTHSDFEKYIVTHDLIRIVPSDVKILRGVLYAFLSSKYGYYQLTQSRYGGVVKHISDKYVESIEVPLFPVDLQQEIDSCVKEAAMYREKAENAKRLAIAAIDDFCRINLERLSRTEVRKMSLKDVRTSYKTRLNAAFYINEGKDKLSESNMQTKRLGDCSVKMWYPGIFKRPYVENGLPYIKGSELFYLNPFRRCSTLSEKRTPNIWELWLKEGMLLISCAGLCGKAKLISKEYSDKKAIGSPDIIRLISKDSLVTTEYIYAYLHLPIVYDYMQSLKYGSVIERFDIGNLENIPVILPTEDLSKQVTSLVNEYLECIYHSFCSEERAVEMVEKEIESWSSK